MDSWYIIMSWSPAIPITLPDGWYGKNAGSSKDGYAYTIYAENFEDWALQEIEPEEVVHYAGIHSSPARSARNFRQSS